jgi:hypothetical protein
MFAFTLAHATAASRLSIGMLGLCVVGFGDLAHAQTGDPLMLRPDSTLSLADALSNGRFSVQLRPRYNRIEEERKPELSDAYTARAVAGWKSAPFHGLRLAVELIHSDRIGSKRCCPTPATRVSTRHGSTGPASLRIFASGGRRCAWTMNAS